MIWTKGTVRQDANQEPDKRVDAGRETWLRLALGWVSQPKWDLSVIGFSSQWSTSRRTWVQRVAHDAPVPKVADADVRPTVLQ